MESGQVARKVPISIVAGKALVFDLDVIKSLRALGIGGVLNGTLPTAPQQNIFLGIPLQLMVEEVVWLVSNSLGFLVPEDEYFQKLIDSLSEDDIHKIKSSRDDDLKFQHDAKLSQLNQKLDKLGKNNTSQEQKSKSITQSLSVTIKDNSNDLPHANDIKLEFLQFQSIQKSLLSQLHYKELDYILFSFLKSKGYFLAPGLRFGGKFIGYPGDPLRYHAHLIINSVQWEEDIGMMNIVNGGRLATGVKKVWLVGSEREPEPEHEPESETKDVVCFSIEWAGFG